MLTISFFWLSVIFYFYFGFWIIIFYSCIGFDNLVTVFVCSIVTDSISTMFGFSKVFDFWVVIFDCFIGFGNLEEDFGCLALTDYMSRFVVFTNVLIFCKFFFAFFKKVNSWYSLYLLEPGIFYVKDIASITKAFFICLFNE